MNKLAKELVRIAEELSNANNSSYKQYLNGVRNNFLNIYENIKADHELIKDFLSNIITTSRDKLFMNENDLNQRYEDLFGKLKNMEGPGIKEFETWLQNEKGRIHQEAQERVKEFQSSYDFIRKIVLQMRNLDFSNVSTEEDFKNVCKLLKTWGQELDDESSQLYFDLGGKKWNKFIVDIYKNYREWGVGKKDNLTDRYDANSILKLANDYHRNFTELSNVLDHVFRDFQDDEDDEDHEFEGLDIYQRDPAEVYDSYGMSGPGFY